MRIRADSGNKRGTETEGKGRKGGKPEETANRIGAGPGGAGGTKREENGKKRERGGRRGKRPQKYFFPQKYFTGESF